MAIDPSPADAFASRADTSDATTTAPVPSADQAPAEGGGPGSSTRSLPAPPTAEAPTPAGSPGRRRTKRIKARQVQRVITRIDPWSTLKVSLLFALSMWLIVVVAGVVLWRVAVATDTIGNFESFLAETLGEDTFTINGGQVFQGSVVVGLVFFVTGAVFAVVTSVLFNLIAGVVGGIRTTVVELETARPATTEPPSGP